MVDVLKEIIEITPTLNTTNLKKLMTSLQTDLLTASKKGIKINLDDIFTIKGDFFNERNIRTALMRTAPIINQNLLPGELLSNAKSLTNELYDLQKILGKGVKGGEAYNNTYKRLSNILEQLGIPIDDVDKKIKSMLKEKAPKIVPEVDIKQKLLSETYKLGSSLNKLEEIGITGAKTNDAYNLTLKKMTSNLKRLGVPIAEIEKNIESIKKSQKQFNFDFLTLMFAGMILQRTFGGIFKTITTNYLSVTKRHTEFGKEVNKVEASFKSLQFAIGSALDSPIVISLLNSLGNALNWISEAAAKNPTVVLAVLGAIGTLATLGTLAVVASGIMQIGNMITILGGAKAAAALAWLTNIKNLGLVTAGVTLIVAGFDIIEDLISGEWADALFKIAGIIAGAGIGFTLGGPGGALIGAAIGFGVTLALRELVGGDIDFNKVKGGAMLFWNSLVDAFFEVLPGWAVLDKINGGITMSLKGFLKFDVETYAKNLSLQEQMATTAEEVNNLGLKIEDLNPDKLNTFNQYNQQALETLPLLQSKFTDLSTTVGEEFLPTLDATNTSLSNQNTLITNNQSSFKTFLTETTTLVDSLNSSLTKTESKLDDIKRAAERLPSSLYSPFGG